ncbi:adenylate/guanylate cyclase domain-containing protein [Roseiarcus fermentans]|nr:adenylate/guanylate cyclase domain-containing protein [Roseiarcus fermentans]
MGPAVGERGAPTWLTPRLVRIALISAALSALSGATYGYLVHDALATGLLFGGGLGALLALLEGGVFHGVAGAGLRRAPFVVYFGVRAGAYVVLIVATLGLVVWLLNGPAALRAISAVDILFTMLASVVANLGFAISDLLGPGVLLSFAAGRYHRPQREERAFLFIDLKGSTALAERLGEAGFLRFLDAFIVDVSREIVDHGGEIHKYVGDEIIATWRLKPGRNDVGIVRAWAAASGRLADRRAAYQREFGDGAEFRAALHAGFVMVGEIGSFKKEIALIGDAMNTAARMLDACRALGRVALASAALIDRLPALPDGVELAPIASLPLRGKAEALALVALALAQETPRPLEAAI